MTRSQIFSIACWILAIGCLVFGVVSTWLANDHHAFKLTGDLGSSWAHIEDVAGDRALPNGFALAAMMGRLTFWLTWALALSTAPAIWYFRYDKTIGRRWVAAGVAIVAFTTIGFVLAIENRPPLQAPFYVFCVGLAVMLVGCLGGVLVDDPKRQPPIEGF